MDNMQIDQFVFEELWRFNIKESNLPPGHKLTIDGIYDDLPEDPLERKHELKHLSPEERLAVFGSKLPAKSKRLLPFPCSVQQLLDYEKRSGYEGHIDREDLADFIRDRKHEQEGRVGRSLPAETETARPSRLIIIINERKAIPVRAIPFVTNFEFDALHTARMLAHIDGWNRVNLASYYLSDGKPNLMLPSRWNTKVHQQEDLPPSGEDDETKISALFANTFVWCDDLEAAFTQAKENGAIAEKNLELNYSPYIPDNISISVVLEGFEVETTEDKNKSNDKGQKSKAPEPINTLKQSPPKLPQFDTSVKGAANWKYWRHIETVELWQALLLSLNIEPPGNGWILDNAAGRTGDIPYEYLDSHGLTNEFIRRSKLLKNNLETHRTKNGIPPDVELTDFIGLSFFASWAVKFEWDNLPPELVALSIVPTAKAPPRLTREQWLASTKESDNQKSDPAYKLQYERAFLLWGELEKWEGMEHQNNPIREEMKQAKLVSIRAELATINDDESGKTLQMKENPLAHRPKQRLQEDAILNLLTDAYGNPKKLPKAQQGKSGAKAAAWSKLMAEKSLFQSKGTFDKAWERLRADGNIKDAE